MMKLQFHYRCTTTEDVFGETNPNREDRIFLQIAKRTHFETEIIA